MALLQYNALSGFLNGQVGDNKKNLLKNECMFRSSRCYRYTIGKQMKNLVIIVYISHF